jgi:hypothetical protein
MLRLRLWLPDNAGRPVPGDDCVLELLEGAGLPRDPSLVYAVYRTDRQGAWVEWSMRVKVPVYA